MDDHDALIDRLSGNARPVKRPLAPGLRTALWVLLALPFGALSVILFDRAFAEWAMPATPWTVAEVLAAFASGVFGLVAAFTLSVPGRKGIAWPWFAAAVMVWLAASLIGIFRSDDPWGHPGSGTGCYLFMVTAGLPMIVLSVLALMRTRTLYPWRTLSAAGLGIAFMTATLMGLCHPPGGDLTDFAGHILAGITLIAITAGLGRRLIAA